MTCRQLIIAINAPIADFHVIAPENPCPNISASTIGGNTNGVAYQRQRRHSRFCLFFLFGETLIRSTLRNDARLNWKRDNVVLNKSKLHPILLLDALAGLARISAGACQTLLCWWRRWPHKIIIIILPVCMLIVLRTVLEYRISATTTTPSA